MDVQQILFQHRQCTRLWHQQVPSIMGDGFAAMVQQNHLENFSLWHEEDIARRNDLGAERVLQAKRAIDRFNQRRNDLVEKMDQWLVGELQPAESGCPFNSETPGMMIDRLSILALKEFHMHEEVMRTDATPEHQTKCAGKLSVIRRQISDLSGALEDLLQQTSRKTRSFRVYFQFKMYNDAELNPQLRKAA